ncbi:XdhC family protein [Kordiimonas lipolytica]|uniref:XdhC family protein n=1 Tax=Kordiimonas lipolytica TaxID=1662421 RepID=A0ABV8U823_9PROT|nr:XdhC family protein [Kordiimonas lipolytica]
MEKIFASLSDWHQSGLKTALAVVTKTWGSAPRGVGSLMAIASDGRFEGSVSGGCVEGTVIAEANQLAHVGGSKFLSFTVSSEQAWEVSLACGGQIEILIIALSGDVSGKARALCDAIKARNAGYVAFDLNTGTFEFQPTGAPSDLAFDDNRLTLPVTPKYRLMIIGAVHIAQHLAPIATDAGYDVTIIDPRAAFTESRSFGDATLIEDWPDDYLAKASLDGHTAVVTLTHDPKIDDVALIPALKSDVFYIGSLGSRKTHSARLSRLEKKDFSNEDLKRIHGPVGLDIGAKTPAEIAISIMAEITLVRRGH